jgi:hypothetical protein
MDTDKNKKDHPDGSGRFEKGSPSRRARAPSRQVGGGRWLNGKSTSPAKSVFICVHLRFSYCVVSV